MANATIRIITPSTAQRDEIIALLPRLASFELPPERDPRHLWEGDAKLLNDWYAGKEPDVHVYCALDQTDQVAGIAIVSLRPELLSEAPSAHLEALAVSSQHEGQGVGSKLLDACHEHARTLGAVAMTLHVFETNRRAQGLYEKKGYAFELRRCIKWLQDEPTDDH